MTRRAATSSLAFHLLFGLAALPVTEAIVRVAKPMDHAMVRPQMAPDQELGQIMRPHVKFFDKGGRPSEYSYHVSTNDIGLRMDRDVGSLGEAHLTLALGDSHVFGWGTELADSLFGRLREALSDRVVLLNAGFPAHSTGHSTVLLRRLLDEHSIQAVAYFLPAGALARNVGSSIFGHYRDQAGKLHLRQRPPHGRLRRLLLTYTPWVWLNQNSHLFVYLKELAKPATSDHRLQLSGGLPPLSPEKEALTADVTVLHVEEMAALCLERSVPLLVVWQPALCETNELGCPPVYERVKALLADNPKFRFFDPTRPFRARVEGAEGPTHFSDGHLTVLGSALFFDALRGDLLPFLEEVGTPGVER